MRVDPFPRLNDVDHQQPDRQRDGRDDFKIDQRTATHPPDLFHIAHFADADDDRQEDDRADDHFHQPDESIGEGLHRLAPFRL